MELREVNHMAKKADPSLKTETGVYHSQYEANEKHLKKYPQDMIAFRLPKGSKQIIMDYVAKKAKEEPDNPKYSTSNRRPSINAYIRDLIEKDMQGTFTADGFVESDK